ncbi:uncharacterized protein LOC115049999 isoform X2 [Echeneis naucrates]|uniref:uncharacterized protein LOC115049999 isoform X2 n=1 Tax=Echeneis naucrates TaxID=173247 RepID=UPI0011143063|nr:uncharacterized protein LOC115049999 isoform X2 [Echeneis naucrates]
METCLLFLLLGLLKVCTSRTDGAECPSLPQKDLTCYTDYDRCITCEWNSGHDHTDAVCKLEAKRVNTSGLPYSATCALKPDSVKPAVKACTMVFNRKGIFQQWHNLSIDLICKPANFRIYYQPSCHVKPNPPGKPEVNLTTVSWLAEINTHRSLQQYYCQLQWKTKDQPWTDPPPDQDPQLKDMQTYSTRCTGHLNPDLLIQGERYETRVRVLAANEDVQSTWSDWSPTASWVSEVGRRKPPLAGGVGQVLVIISLGSVFTLFMAVVLLRNKKATWVYKKLRGPAIPDPGRSFLKDNWVSPGFTTQLFPLSLQMEEIVLVEPTSTVKAVTLHKREEALKEKMRMETSYDSSFSNPSYSHLCTPPPAPLPSTDNLEPRAADRPDGSVGSQDGGKNAEEDKEEERKKELEILQLLSKGNNNDSEPVQVISDYEKVEKPQVERLRLQSLDSGVCSGEEVSQESLEADSISVVDGHDEGSEVKEELREGGNGKVDFQTLFGGGGSVFGKGSIQVCSDYEQVQRPLLGSPELVSQDSGICSGGEEQASHEETPEDFEKSFGSKKFQFPPALSCTLPCSLPSFPQLPLKFSGMDLSSALQPQSPDHVLKKIGLISESMSMAPSSDGYRPVRQEQS